MDTAGYPASAEESGFVSGKRIELGEAVLVVDGSNPFVSPDLHDHAKGASGLFTTHGEGT